MSIGPNWLEETKAAKDYRAFVGAPEEYDINGALQFNLLILLGLREHHKLLDVGCGSLRAGRLFVMYLASGNYYGIDPERWLVEEAIEHELGPGLSDLRQPQFSDTVNFNAEPFDVVFDYVLCQSVYTHAPQGMIALSLREAAKVMGPQSIFAATYMESEDDNSDTHKWHYPFVTHFTRERITELCNGAGLAYIHIDWHHPKGCRWFLACVSDYEPELRAIVQNAHQLGPRQVWVVGRNVKGRQWHFVGVFDTEEAALAACTSPDHFSTSNTIMNEARNDECRDTK